MYRSYCEDWHSKKRYQFDSYQCDDEQVFVYDPIEKNIALEYVPKDTVPMDVVAANDGYRVCNHCSRIPIPEPSYEPIDFQSFVQTQTEYISQYYADIHFDITPVQLYNMIKEKKQLIFATDGGEVKFKGSLGFLLTDESGDRILACYGQPAGHDPLSYRAEIHAFLAALRLINLLVEYYEGMLDEKCKMGTKFHLFTDSKSMLDKLKKT